MSMDTDPKRVMDNTIDFYTKENARLQMEVDHLTHLLSGKPRQVHEEAGDHMSEKLYTVRCGTGCTCCASENHTRGLYVSEEAAVRRIKRFESLPLLASQYSKTGRYVPRSYEVERLPDGRVIVAGERVVAEDSVFDVSPEGDLLLKGEKIGDFDSDRLGDDYWP